MVQWRIYTDSEVGEVESLFDEIGFGEYETIDTLGARVRKSGCVEVAARVPHAKHDVLVSKTVRASILFGDVHHNSRGVQNEYPCPLGRELYDRIIEGLENPVTVNMVGKRISI
jgi:hypothetical protein